MKVLFLAGLPGSGKTTYAESLKDEGFELFDDFMSHSVNDSFLFARSRKLQPLLDAIHARKDCIVSDISYCDSDRRLDAESTLREIAPTADIEWRFFENSPSKCEVNIRNRRRPSLILDLQMLYRFADFYSIPVDATVIPISQRAPLKISIDFDGTMWSHMQFFRDFMWAMKTAGNLVGCLTGHGEVSKDPDIQLMIARGFPAPDFWFGRTEEYLPFNGAKYKSDVILRENISMHFDDFDFNNPETERIFKERLGNQFYRIVKVQHREPTNVHYE